MLASTLFRNLIQDGCLAVIDANGRHHLFGRPADPQSSAAPITLRIHDKALHHRLLLRPKLAFGEAYMDGTLTIENGEIYDCLDVLARNLAIREPVGGRLYEWLAPLAGYIQSFNPIRRSVHNVAHHYNLSPELYTLFLDADRQYSCAYFASDNDSLETAQLQKKQHIAAKLLLKPGQTLLDIGCGWGGLALYLAQHTPLQITGITLSEEQLHIAKTRADKAGLTGRVEFRLQDYREAGGQFDRIVSVGMFEHVGKVNYLAFFRKLKSLLTEDGVALLHSIGRMEPPGATNPWLRKYIFPGGYTPALSEVMRAIERAGLYVTDMEVLRLHYAKTLAEWRRRFNQNRERARALYDERFCRMWDFYLAGCEVAFRYLNQMVFQIQLARQQDAVPLTRDYIFAATQTGRLVNATEQ